MSGQVLSADAIAALVDAAKQGKLPDESHAPARRRRMRAVDFTRPTKFTSDQMRRLKRGLEAFSRTASTRLSAELRMPLELEVINATQLTWGNAHGQMESNAIAAVVATRPIDTRMVLTAEPELVLGTIELLLGGNLDEPVTPRRFTDIDWALARHFFDRLLTQLSIIWTDLANVSLDLNHLDTHLETAQMVSVSEPTLAMTMEARLNGASSLLTLFLPWSAIAPIADRFSARDDSHGIRGDEEVKTVRKAVGRVEMTVRAEVASVQMPIEEVLALQPGDVLRLEAPAEGGVTLFADKVPVHVGKPGRSGSRRAVQVSGRVGVQR
jgi:flagellar motor switch protein FliM